VNFSVNNDKTRLIINMKELGTKGGKYNVDDLIIGTAMFPSQIPLFCCTD
jgi:hypothetical protein